MAVKKTRRDFVVIETETRRIFTVIRIADKKEFSAIRHFEKEPNIEYTTVGEKGKTKQEVTLQVTTERNEVREAIYEYLKMEDKQGA